jgi:hypothetical protein
MACLGLENPRPTLTDDLLDQGQVVFERSFCGHHLEEKPFPL